MRVQAEDGEGRNYWGKQQTLSLIAAVEKFEVGSWADIKAAQKEEFMDKSSDNLRVWQQAFCWAFVWNEDVFWSVSLSLRWIEFQERWKNLTAYDKRRAEGVKKCRKNSLSFYPDDKDMERIRKCNALKKMRTKEK